MTVVEADADQQRVVDAGAGERLLVAAGPGSGKTWTAAQRLARLAVERRHSDVDSDGGRFLAISFSRAAAAATEQQLHAAGVGAHVEVRTIDSWCTRLLNDSGMADDALDVTDYDGRIKRCLAAIVDSSVHVPELGHLVVDEAQDIVGIRAEFLSAVLDLSTTHGWTVLGDPAQAVYDFGEQHMRHLFGVLSQPARPDVRAVELTMSHRAQTPALVSIRELGSGLRALSPSLNDLEPVWDAYRGLSSMTLSQFLVVAAAYAAEVDQSAALVRDNRLVLRLSAALGEQRIEHEVAAGRSEGIVPSWVAGLWPDQGSMTTLDEIAAAVPDGLSPGPVVRAVNAVCRARGSRFAVGPLADRLRARQVPEPLLQSHPRGLVVSTAHRAKGLEFNRVLVGLDFIDDLTAPSAVDETRLLYVAMTRAKHALRRLIVGRTHAARLSQGRWVDKEHPGPRARVTAVELRPGDIDLLQPTLTLSERIESLARAAIGDAVILEWRQSGQDGHLYDVRAPIDGALLGRTTPRFADVLRVGGWTAPAILSGALVTGRQTLALLTPEVATASSRRLIQAPVIRGMVAPEKGA